MNTKRIEYIDAMRGFTMVLVVLAHIINLCYHVVDEDMEAMHTFNLLFVRFRMPLFFFVSGFVLWKAGHLLSWKERKDFLYKKFMVQIIPTAVFFSLFVFINGSVYADGLFSVMKYGYWFTISLFEFFVLYVLFRILWPRCWSHDMIGLLVYALCVYLGSMVYKYYSLAHGAMPWLDLLNVAHLRFFVFFALGVAVRKHYSRVCGWLDNQYVMASMIILLPLSFFGISSFFSYKVYNTLSFIPEGILGIGIVLAFFRKNEGLFTRERLAGRCLQYVGRRTLDVYLLHYLFLPTSLAFMGEWFMANPNPTLEFFCSLALAVMVIVVCLVVSNVIRLSPFLGHYLFGVKNKC